MRLMCPNCDAEYEVDASAIPESGRDVQCSNCGHAWFQQHPDHEADSAAEAALYDPPPPLSKAGMQETMLPSDLDWLVESDDPEAILDAMGREAREHGPNTPQDPAMPADDANSVTPESGTPDRTMSERADPIPKHDLDPEALRILREEAELETAQRALDQGRAAGEPATAPIVARRVARLKGIQPPMPNPITSAKLAPAAPIDRLPKIDAVSAALRQDGPLADTPIPHQKTGRGGALMMGFITLAATTAYVFSPDLSVLLPSFAKPLAHYVAVVDSLRDQLDILLPKVTAQLNAWMSQMIVLGGQAITLVKGWF